MSKHYVIKTTRTLNLKFFFFFFWNNCFNDSATNPESPFSGLTRENSIFRGTKGYWTEGSRDKCTELCCSRTQALQPWLRWQEGYSLYTSFQSHHFLPAGEHQGVDPVPLLLFCGGGNGAGASPGTEWLFLAEMTCVPSTLCGNCQDLSEK